MKAVVVIAFYVWLALTVAIVLGRLARWSASRQASKRRRKARAAARENGATWPATATASGVHETIDLDAEVPPNRSDAPIERPATVNVPAAASVEAASAEAAAAVAEAASVEAAAEAAAAEERRAAERRASERRVADRRNGDRRQREASAPSATDRTTTPAAPGSNGVPSHAIPTEPLARPTEPRQPSLAPAAAEPLGRPEPMPASAVTPTAPMPAPEPAVAPAPTLPQLLAGIAIPVDLVPIIPEGSTTNDQSTTLISRQRPAYEVGSGIADELERLGYSLTPVGEAALLATRGADVLTVEIDPTPNQSDGNGFVRFPTAAPTDVVVEFWVGSGPRPG